MRAWTLMAFLGACRFGFDPLPLETGQDLAGSDVIDAAATTADGVVAPGDTLLGIPCDMRVPNTDNAYVPHAACIAELDMARATCNADSACVLTGWYWYAGSGGINDTGACADGGGNTGCRQWTCSTRGMVPTDHLVI